MTDIVSLLADITDRMTPSWAAIVIACGPIRRAKRVSRERRLRRSPPSGLVLMR